MKKLKPAAFLSLLYVILFCNTCDFHQNEAVPDLSDESDQPQKKLSAPENVEASVASSNSINISWKAVDGAVIYKIYRAKNSSSGAYIGVGNSYEIYFIDAGLEFETSYYYKVTAVDSSNVSGKESQYAYARTSKEPPPGAENDPPEAENKPSSPSGISASAESSCSITVSWNPVSNVEKYHVYRAISSTGGYADIGETFGSSYTDSALKPDTYYYYKVSSVKVVDNKDIEGDKSNYKSARTKSLDAPSSVNASVESGNTVYISWSQADYAETYKVYRQLGFSGARVYLGECDIRSYTDSGLDLLRSDSHTTNSYYYCVTTIDIAGNESAYSSRSGSITVRE